MALVETLNRLRRRKIVEWALAYLASAWLVMQLVEVLAGRWPLPMALQRGVDLLLLVGFFVALTLAWYHGEKGRQGVTGPELLILALLLSIAGGLLWMFGPAKTPTETGHGTTFEQIVTPDSARGIAVLPFRNLSGESGREYFVNGIHEALTTSLSQIGGLRIISRTTMMRYAETEQSIPEIAAELNVDSVIQGSVNTIGDQARISVQLIDAQTDSHIWADEYDRDLSNVLVLLSQVAESIAERVEVSLAPEDAALLRSAQPVDPDLHDLYLRGRHAYHQLTPDGMAQAIDYLEEAIAIDPGYAAAWAGLSAVHVLRGYVQFAPPQESMVEAERVALKAIELDPQDADAHTSLGWVRLFQYNWEEARHHLARALQLNPNHPDALHGFGDYLTIIGSGDDGFEFVKRAWANDPFSPFWGHAVIVHLHMMGRFEEAIEEAEELLKVLPNSPVWTAVGNAHWKLGRQKKAFESFRFGLSRRPEILKALENGYARDGLPGAFAAAADAAAKRASERGAGHLQAAFWYARAGDTKQTLDWLERAHESGAPDMIYAGVRPEFEFLHTHPGFIDLLARMNLASH